MFISSNPECSNVFQFVTKKTAAGNIWNALFGQLSFLKTIITNKNVKQQQHRWRLWQNRVAVFQMAASHVCKHCRHTELWCLNSATRRAQTLINLMEHEVRTPPPAKLKCFHSSISSGMSRQLPGIKFTSHFFIPHRFLNFPSFSFHFHPIQHRN